LTVAALLLGATGTVLAQDPVKVDAEHYQVLFEDAQIRVLRITYGPHEKSVMHEHPVGTCAVMLTAAQLRMHTPDGKFTEDPPAKPGDVICTAAGPGTEKHNPENMANGQFSAVLVERNVYAKP
jgi:hypothetical protein